MDDRPARGADGPAGPTGVARSLLAMVLLAGAAQAAALTGGMWAVALEPSDNTARFYLGVSAVYALVSAGLGWAGAAALGGGRRAVPFAGYLLAVAVTVAAVDARSATVLVVGPLLAVLVVLAARRVPPRSASPSRQDRRAPGGPSL